MSLCANVSELARELRMAAGTVLSIVGSRLEAQERARVDEVGPQWLTEFEEQRDSLEPCMCYGDCEGKRNRRCVMADEESTDDEDEQRWDCLACELGSPEGCTADAYFGEVPLSSAATPHAADPSPARPSPSPASAVDEGSGGDSDILPSPPPERPQCGAQYWCRDLYTCSRPLGHDGGHGYAGSWAKGVGPDRGTCVRCGRPLGESALAADQGGYWCSVACHQLDQDSCPAPPVVAGESPRGVSTDQPSLGEPICDNLADLLHRAADVLFASDAHCPALIAELRTRADRFAAVESVIGYGRGTAGE